LRSNTSPDSLTYREIAFAAGVSGHFYVIRRN
jgi:hypothetical protein